MKLSAVCLRRGEEKREERREDQRRERQNAGFRPPWCSKYSRALAHRAASHMRRALSWAASKKPFTRAYHKCVGCCVVLCGGVWWRVVACGGVWCKIHCVRELTVV